MAIAIIVFLLAVGFSLIGLLIKILKGPMKLALKIFIHALMGFVFLFIFNFIGAWVCIGIPSTWLNAAVAGVFGVPGVVVLLILQII